MTDSSEPKKSASLIVVLAWAVVIIPAAWGITQTLRTSAKLFTSAPTTQPGTLPLSK